MYIIKTTDTNLNEGKWTETVLRSSRVRAILQHCQNSRSELLKMSDNTMYFYSQ